MGGGHSRLRNAFTLIELLAIIVILAIIAVITVPIILNVIDNAKRGSVIDSAYGYKDAVQKFYVSKLYEDANFKFENGTYTVETLKTMGVSVDGTSPTDDSWIEIINNQVNDYSLKFDEWVVNYDKDTKQPVATKGDVALTSTQQILANIPKTLKEDGRKYFDAEWVSANPVYFNPESNDTSCTAEETGCMKWYAYSENSDGTINMILDHNTTPTLSWVTSSDYSAGNGIPQKAKDVGLTYQNISEENPYGIFNTNASVGDAYKNTGNWNKGPITLLYQLQQDTSSWNSTVINRDSYGSYTNKNKFFDSSNPDNPNYIINYSGYNARIITAQEFAYIIGVSLDERTTTSDKSFNTTTYAWLLENLSNTYSNTSLPWGYWTSSSNAVYYNYAWNVFGISYANLASGNDGSLTASTSIGLRPIITVSSSVLSGS